MITFFYPLCLKNLMTTNAYAIKSIYIKYWPDFSDIKCATFTSEIILCRFQIITTKSNLVWNSIFIPQGCSYSCLGQLGPMGTLTEMGSQILAWIFPLPAVPLLKDLTSFLFHPIQTRVVSCYYAYLNAILQKQKLNKIVLV